MSSYWAFLAALGSGLLKLCQQVSHVLWQHQDSMSHFKGQLVEANEGKTHGLAVQELDQKPGYGPTLCFQG